MVLQAIDISNNNSVVDFAQVAAAGYQGALIKASEGTTYPDAFLGRNSQGASAQGLLMGLWHFGLPAWNDGAAEAAWYIHCASPWMAPGVIPILDLEPDPYGRQTPPDCGPYAEAWVDAVRQAFGCWPWLYTNLDMIQNHGVNTPKLANCGLWLAAPGAQQPPAPAPWPFVACWQRSWNGGVPGIAGKVDLDTFNGERASWLRYGMPEPVQKPALDDRARLQGCVYLGGGSGVQDMVAWLSGFAD